MYLIKRYANGRFYDTVEKKYTTRDRIIGLANSGKDISIVETKTGNDITRRVLSGFVVDRDYAPEADAGSETEERDALAAVLGWFLKRGEDVYIDLKKQYDALSQNIRGTSADEVDGLLASLRKTASAGEKEAGSLKEEIDRHRKHFHEWFSLTIDKRIDDALRQMNLASRGQVREISKSLEKLNKKLDRVEKEVVDQLRKKDDDQTD